MENIEGIIKHSYGVIWEKKAKPRFKGTDTEEVRTFKLSKNMVTGKREAFETVITRKKFFFFYICWSTKKIDSVITKNIKEE